MSTGVLSETLTDVTAPREATATPWILDSFVDISSAMPSLKYVLSGSVLRFWRGSTAMDGRAAGATVGLEVLRYHRTPKMVRSEAKPMPAAYAKRRSF